MASTLTLVTTGLPVPRPSSSSNNDGDVVNGGTRPTPKAAAAAGGRNEDPLNWCAWAHQGHRLWEVLPESFCVYTYKVDRYPLPGNHVWTACPYAHRGERARRRDPRSFAYAAVDCPDYAESKRQLRRAGSSAAPTCVRGLSCGYAHGLFEMWLHPTRFRTVMCQAGAACPRRVCFFAHRLEQRRRHGDDVPLVIFRTTPPQALVPRLLPASASASSSSRSRSRSRSRSGRSTLVARPVDRVAQAMQQGRTVRLLTRGSDAGASSSSSSPTSGAAAATTTAAASTARARARAPQMLQASSPSPSPVDDEEEIDIVAIVTRCCVLPRFRGRLQG